MKIRPLAAGLALTAAAFAGCAPEADDLPAMTDAPPVLDPHAGHDHGAHPTEGPHGGGLIELGDEEYHGELIHDEAAGTITVYLLNDHADEAVPIEATEVSIFVKLDGAPETYVLTAVPQGDDPAGQSSRFVSGDTEFDRQLGERLNAEGVEARLMVRIADRSYSGDIAHEDGGHDGH